MTTKKAQFWGLSDSQLSRRIALGLDHPVRSSFIAKHEFVSLGSSCSVVEALKTLGLRKFAYPFDWTRAPLDGILHCLQTDFVDFLTFTHREIRQQGLAHTGTRWGGSIWFHDLQQPESQSTFTRRIKRFVGEGEVKPADPRVFVWAANTARELESTLQLRASIEQMLPEAEVLLLVLVNLQSVQGPLSVSSIGWGVVFYGIDAAIFRERDEQTMLAKERHAYEAALAFAINAWSTERALADVVEVQSLAELVAACDQFNGGDPTYQLFFPRRVQGYPILVDVSRSAAEQQREKMLAKRLLADSLTRARGIADAEDSKHRVEEPHRRNFKQMPLASATGNKSKISEGPLPPLHGDLLETEHIAQEDIVEHQTSRLSASSDIGHTERIVPPARFPIQSSNVASKVDGYQDLRIHRERLELELRWWSLIEDAGLHNAWPASREPGILLSFARVPWPPPPHFEVAVRGCLVRLGAPQVANWILNVFDAEGFGVIVALTGPKTSIQQLHRVPLSALVAMRYSVSDVVWNPKLVAPALDDATFRSAEQLGSRLPSGVGPGGMAGAGSLKNSEESSIQIEARDSGSDSEADSANSSDPSAGQ